MCVGLTLASVLLINKIYIICSERRKLMFEKKRTSYPAADQYEKSLVAKPTKQKHFEAGKKIKKISEAINQKSFSLSVVRPFSRNGLQTHRPLNSTYSKLNVLFVSPNILLPFSCSPNVLFIRRCLYPYTMVSEATVRAIRVPMVMVIPATHKQTHTCSLVFSEVLAVEYN